MYKLLILFFLITGSTFGIYIETIPTGSNTITAIIHFRAETTEFNSYWETGNYTSNIVARLVAEDERRVARNLTRVDTNNLNSTTVKWITRKYTWSMTNSVHWMKAHAATTNDPYIVANLWHEWGYVNLYWKEKLTDPKWECIRQGTHRFDPRVYNRVTIYMHPESSITKRMMKAKTGFFCQSANGPYTRTYHNGEPHIRERLFSVDLSNFFPKPVIESSPKRSSVLMIKPSGPPAIPN